MKEQIQAQVEQLQKERTQILTEVQKAQAYLSNAEARVQQINGALLEFDKLLNPAKYAPAPTIVAQPVPTEPK
jgi:chaperonin cofactor prefoldin